MATRWHQRVRSFSRGDSLLELALTLPILLTICVGLFQYGLVLLAQNQLLFAAREGARQAALYGNPDVGTTAAIQNITSVPWVKARAVANGCNAYGEACAVEMCATYYLIVPFVHSGNITLSAYAEALTERQTNGKICSDSQSFGSASTCTVQHLNTCPGQ